MASENDQNDGYTLHMFPFSLYSIMVMYTHVLGREVDNGQSGLILSNKLVNLHRDENIKEEYLDKINAKGLVY